MVPWIVTLEVHPMLNQLALLNALFPKDNPLRPIGSRGCCHISAKLMLTVSHHTIKASFKLLSELVKEGLYPFSAWNLRTLQHLSFPRRSKAH